MQPLGRQDFEQNRKQWLAWSKRCPASEPSVALRLMQLMPHIRKNIIGSLPGKLDFIVTDRDIRAPRCRDFTNEVCKPGRLVDKCSVKGVGI